MEQKKCLIKEINSACDDDKEIKYFVQNYESGTYLNKIHVHYQVITNK